MMATSAGAGNVPIPSPATQLASDAAASGHPLSGDFAGRTRALREAIVAKNRLYFHRWRPANETYLFLFRRHEQGNNAVEIPQFDPLVAEADAAVRTLAREVR